MTLHIGDQISTDCELLFSPTMMRAVKPAGAGYLLYNLFPRVGVGGSLLKSEDYVPHLAGSDWKSALIVDSQAGRYFICNLGDLCKKGTLPRIAYLKGVPGYRMNAFISCGITSIIPDHSLDFTSSTTDISAGGPSSMDIYHTGKELMDAQGYTPPPDPSGDSHDITFGVAGATGHDDNTQVTLNLLNTSLNLNGPDVVQLIDSYGFCMDPPICTRRYG